MKNYNKDLAKFIFENNSIGMAICSTGNNTIEHVNTAFADMLERTPKELIGFSLSNIFAPKVLSQLYDFIDSEVSRHSNVSFETEFVRKDGTRIIVSLCICFIQGEETQSDRQYLTYIHDITSQKLSEAKADYLSNHDPLTKLPNRILAKDRALQAISRSRTLNTKVAILVIDLDNFKTINDSLGHSIGDIILQSTADRLKECIRETETVSRQGDDEFLIIVPDVIETDSVANLTKKIIKSFEKPFGVGSNALPLSVSIGISIFPDDGDDFFSLLQKADTAMYTAKEDGKNTFRFFTTEMNSMMFEYLTLQSELKKALEQDQFILYYQPKINLKHNKIYGVEVLLRWQHPTKGIVPPKEFIHVAESSGVIVQIGEKIIKTACMQASKWHLSGITLSVAVNISALQFKRGDLCEVVIEALQESKLPPEYLELELTESVLLKDSENVLTTVQRLKQIGVQLSLDDFGTGYSSLAYLKKFSVDKLKIDQSFVKDILSDPEDKILVRAIIRMAKSLNLKTIAEGVENEKTVKLLAAQGCDEVQGFYYAKPMPAEDFEGYFLDFERNFCGKST